MYIPRNNQTICLSLCLSHSLSLSLYIYIHECVRVYASVRVNVCLWCVIDREVNRSDIYIYLYIYIYIYIYMYIYASVGRDEDKNLYHEQIDS